MDLLEELCPRLIRKNGEAEEKGNRRLDIFYTFLSDLSDDQYEHAIVKFITRRKEVFPDTTNVVAVLREYALEGKIKTGLEAWAETKQAIRHGIKIEDDAAERAAIAIGLENIKWDGIEGGDQDRINRAHFIKAYERIRDGNAARKISGMVNS